MDFFLVYCICFILALALAFYHLTNTITKHSRPQGCRKLGLGIRSNLADEHQQKYTQGVPQSKERGSESTWTVKSLWIYPVKSCKGVELTQGTIVSTGMEYDRQFSFAQLKEVKSPASASLDVPEPEEPIYKWEFITQRTFPLLATVKTEVWIPDPSSPTYSSKKPAVQSCGMIIIRYPREKSSRYGMAALIARVLGKKWEKSIVIPMNPPLEKLLLQGCTMEQMTIWKDSPKAINFGPIITEELKELKEYLKVKNPMTLFRVAEKHQREVYRCAPRKLEFGYQPVVGFADAYPLHIMNLASVLDVGGKLDEGAPTLSALQFRSNIIITGPPAFTEDDWKRIRIGDSVYHVSCRTVRCLLPNVDQSTGIKHDREPNKTLRSFRCIDEGAGKFLACLGMQMVPALEESKIKVGDAIEVLETGEHYYLKQ